jgi:hypothetical protein
VGRQELTQLAHLDVTPDEALRDDAKFGIGLVQNEVVGVLDPVEEISPLAAVFGQGAHGPKAIFIEPGAKRDLSGTGSSVSAAEGVYNLPAPVKVEYTGGGEQHGDGCKSTPRDREGNADRAPDKDLEERMKAPPRSLPDGKTVTAQQVLELELTLVFDGCGHNQRGPTRCLTDRA